MKSLKFLALGAVATGLLATSAMAANTNEEVLKNNITKEINQLVQQQRDNGFLKQETTFEFKIVSPTKKYNPNTQQYEEVTVLSENEARMINKQCKISLAYDKEGNAPALSSDKDILEVTKLQNETQKSMLREFVALHESFHCEFANIENPVKTEGKSHEFNQKINYYLKEINHANNITEEGNGDYLNTLNENFADISASGILLKKYGQDNKDLNFVIKSVETQRHAQYLNRSTSNHFTHFGLNNAMQDNNLNKLIGEKNGDNFKQIALDIANKSTQQLMANKSEMAEAITSSQPLSMGLIFNITRHIGYEILSSEERIKHNIENPNSAPKGIIEDITREALKGEDIRASLNINSSTDVAKIGMDKVIDYSSKLMTKKNVAGFMETEIKQFTEYMTDFKNVIYQQNKDNQEQLNASHKVNSTNNIFSLRTKFLESTKNSNSLTIK